MHATDVAGVPAISATHPLRRALEQKHTFCTTVASCEGRAQSSVPAPYNDDVPSRMRML
jgi:hypothetical protein